MNLLARANQGNTSRTSYNSGFKIAHWNYLSPSYLRKERSGVGLVCGEVGRNDIDRINYYE